VAGDKSTDVRLGRIRTELLKHVPKGGGPVGNSTLRKKLSSSALKVKEDEYWTARNTLIADGVLTKGRGKGGSVYLVKPERVAAKAKGTRRTESALYAPFEKAIISGYVPDYEIKDYVIARTAQQGARKTGGKWTRPDLTVIAMRQYQFIPGKKIEIITFEIKPDYTTALDGVFEALAHSAFAHRTYLAVDISSYNEGDDLPDERIISECERFGLGYITFDDVDDYDTYDFYIPAKLKDPDPKQADEFIATQVGDSDKNTIRSWWKF
jgi:hypothetical protein